MSNFGGATTQTVVIIGVDDISGWSNNNGGDASDGLCENGGEKYCDGKVLNLLELMEK